MGSEGYRAVVYQCQVLGFLYFGRLGECSRLWDMPTKVGGRDMEKQISNLHPNGSERERFFVPCLQLFFKFEIVE